MTILNGGCEIYFWRGLATGLFLGILITLNVVGFLKLYFKNK